MVYFLSKLQCFLCFSCIWEPTTEVIWSSKFHPTAEEFLPDSEFELTPTWYVFAWYLPFILVKVQVYVVFSACNHFHAFWREKRHDAQPKLISAPYARVWRWLKWTFSRDIKMLFNVFVAIVIPNTTMAKRSSLFPVAELEWFQIWKELKTGNLC